MPQDTALQVGGVTAAPLTYTVPGAGEIIFKQAFARFDGTSAAVSFYPCVRIKAPGGTIMAEYITSSTVVAGASADVTWFPGLGGAGGAASLTAQIQIPLDTPDASGNGYVVLTTRQGFSTVRRLLPTFVNGADGNWSGSLAVPINYASGAELICMWVADATSGALRHTVATSVVAVGATADPSYTTESYVNTTVPATANNLFTTTFTLSSTPAASSTLNVQVLRNGANAADTLAASAQLFALVFQYTTT